MSSLCPNEWLQIFPQFPEYSVEFWNPRGSQIPGVQNCKLRLTRAQPCPGEQCTVTRLMAVTKLTTFKALPSCHKHCSHGRDNRNAEFSPSSRDLQPCSPASRSQEGTGNIEILPSTSLLPTLNWQGHKCTQSNTQGGSVPALLQDTCESLLILPQPEGRAQAPSALGYSPPWRKHGCALPRGWKVREVQGYDGTHPVWS